MRNAWTLLTVTVLATAVMPLSPASAQALWPAIPAEIGVSQIGRAGWFPYRCSAEPAHNFYHNALYYEAPAVHLGYAYRPYYRYTAWHVIPRTYSCVER
jgi:hypothetical protein